MCKYAQHWVLIRRRSQPGDEMGDADSLTCVAVLDDRREAQNWADAQNRDAMPGEDFYVDFGEGWQ